jgi:hypothetical protein
MGIFRYELNKELHRVAIALNRRWPQPLLTFEVIFKKAEEQLA